MAKLSGYLIDPTEKPLKKASIELMLLGTTPRLLKSVPAYIFATDDTGYYEATVLPGKYNVKLSLGGGISTQLLGKISVTENSPDGTINSFLEELKEADLTPPIVNEVKTWVNTAREAAEEASGLVNLTKTAVQRAGDTMTGELNVPRLSINAGKKVNGIKISPALPDYQEQGAALYSQSNWAIFNPDSNLAALTIAVRDKIAIFGSQADTESISSTPKIIINAKSGNINVTGGYYYKGMMMYSPSNTIVSTNNLLKYVGEGNGETAQGEGGMQRLRARSVKAVSKKTAVMRLFTDKSIIELSKKQGFSAAGDCGVIMKGMSGIIAKRISVGHYEIRGALGLTKEGWHIELPEDANGNKKIFAEYSTDEKNVITVKTYTRKFDVEKCEIVAGELVDIPDGRWIDLRIEMQDK